MGNARLQGLEEQVLGNNDTRFSVCLAVFYVAYIVCNIPGMTQCFTLTHGRTLTVTITGNISAKIFSPAHSLGVAALIWGVASTLQAVTFNYAGLIACRIFIGVGEAGFSAVVPLYYS
jgi:MFS family permease